MKTLQKYYLIQLAFLPFAGNLFAQPPPTLGNYPDTMVLVSANTTVTPDTGATGATSINVATGSDFKGVLVAHPTTGAVRITNPHPAGTYVVTVKAFNSGSTTSRTFTLTVVGGIVCDGTLQFTNGADVSTGTEPVSVAIGDFNNDGNQDFASANASADAVAIRLGDGLGGFSGTSTVSVGDSPRIAAIGDFNNDGKQDFATANFFANTVSVRLGDGLGGFSGTTEVSVGAAPISLAIGDFNNDGRQDFACANVNAGTNTVSIRLGDGLGGFSGTTDVSVGAGPVSVVIGDFNHDGKQDFASANGPDNTVSIRLGDGLGGFSGTTEVSVDTGPRGLAIGDFNNDGKQDFACANQAASTVSIRLGDGLGGFSGTTNLSVGDTPIAVAMGDFDNDGHQDFATANFNADTVSIGLGDGLGGFGGVTDVGVGDGPRSVAIGDFNKDGTQDFAAGNFTASAVSIRLGGCLCPPVITQSTSQAIIVQSLECFLGGTNAYWRAFKMATVAGSQQYEVTSVSFGIESATGAGGTQPVTVRLHTTTNFPVGFPGSLTQIATTTVPVPDSASGTVVTVPLAATVPAGTSQLVMEVFTPDSPDLFVIGSNTAPETGPGYHSAPSCGFPTPRTAADLGFPNIHIVFNVFGGCAPALTPTAASRQTHAAAGDFDINLPLTGNSGIECRSGGATNDYQVVFNFPSAVTFSSASVSAGTGSVSSSSGSGTPTVTANLTGVTNAQRITVTLLGVSNGTSTADVGVQMGVLVGDTNGDGFVNLGDALQTRNRSGQVTDATNFRSDVNADGFVNSGDTTAVRARSGTSLPPPMNCAENFDGVTAPTLPASWVATNFVGNTIRFATTTISPDSPPNSLALPDQSSISDKVVETPSFIISSATAQLTFRNSYDMETSDADYDGCVLEVSSPNINGGAYTDILAPAVGGSFVTGGYNVNLFIGSGNPIEGRMAWGSSSGGYITTVVNLGPNVTGQTIKLRFRMGTDQSVGGIGWHIDTLSLTGGTCP